MELEVNIDDCGLMALPKETCSSKFFFLNTPPQKIALTIIHEINQGKFMRAEEERIKYLKILKHSVFDQVGTSYGSNENSIRVQANHHW
jgi:hypothetical protein